MSWIGLPVSFAVGLVVVPAAIRALVDAGHLRENYRGARLGFPAGAMVVCTSILALAPLAFLDDRFDEVLLEPELRGWAVYVLGIAFLGLIDDALGAGHVEGTPRGWRGHAAALRAGRLSTGVIKAVGALALATYAVSGRGEEIGMYVADVALLILATNLLNLLDTGPGRAEKAALLAIGGICLAEMDGYPVELLGVFLGPFCVGMIWTLRERAMLGDTGSNVLGALVGIVLIVSLGEAGRLIALAVVAALTVLAEFRSLGAMIESVPLLRHLDSLGRVQVRQKGEAIR